MRKTILALTTVGLLAVPAGMAVAQSGDDPVPEEPVPTCVDPEHDRDRDRDRTGESSVPGDQDQQQTQLRTQERVHDGDCDGDGDQARQQARQQDQADPASGDGAMHRRGEAGGAGHG